ncbi:MAG: hypothetical protein ACYTFI_18990 [Planctomycetota bacterium]|jgi:hypothetical protein
MRDRMAQAAAAMPKGRRGATTARARTPGRRFSGRGTQGMRARTPRSSPTAFYIVAGVIAVLSLAVIMAVLMSRKRTSRLPDGPRPPRPVRTGTTTTKGTGATGKAPTDRPAGDGTVTLPVTAKTPTTTKDDGPGKHGTSLFGPGGTLDAPTK